MTIWKTIAVTEQPEIMLSGWQIREVTDADGATTRHFVGYCEHNNEGRASSEIKEFDSKNLTGRTRSGRVYQLAAGKHYLTLDQVKDIEYVWGAWKRINRIVEDKDVSNEAIRHEPGHLRQ